MFRKVKSMIALAAIASSHAAMPDAATKATLDHITPAVGGGAYRQYAFRDQDGDGNPGGRGRRSRGTARRLAGAAFLQRPPAAGQPGSAQRAHYGRRFSDDEFPAGVRRRERVLPRQRRADVPGRGLGQVHARPANQRLSGLAAKTGAVAIRAGVELLHCRCHDARAATGAGDQTECSRLCSSRLARSGNSRGRHDDQLQGCGCRSPHG